MILSYLAVQSAGAPVAEPLTFAISAVNNKFSAHKFIDFIGGLPQNCYRRALDPATPGQV
jgi:hypothetical protein